MFSGKVVPCLVILATLLLFYMAWKGHLPTKAEKDATYSIMLFSGGKEVRRYTASTYDLAGATLRFKDNLTTCNVVLTGTWVVEKF